MWLKNVLRILLVLILLGSILMVYLYIPGKDTETNLMLGEHHVLVLAADPGEQRPGIGAIDMAFVVTVVDGDIKNMTAVYPGGMAHPTEAAPAEVQAQGVQVLLLHDSFWWNDTAKDAKLAQEIVEYNTGLKSDAVVVFTPDAVDAMINSVGGVYVEGVGTVNGSSIDFLRDEQALGNTRGASVESLMKPLWAAYQDPTKKTALMQAVANQYIQGNIVVEPEALFVQFALANGITKIFT
ncbi:DUF4012 domain-containing protein [Methanobacterium sp. CWC-01]|uniref:DUF4012 domain-containing protein n=1 Tax=Methanobacterium aridiramus TaxID=2584467 RepID=UPI002576BEDA|nr:DUF4012 domain-containing protein [Methanobacterium sp. CWC-01]WJI08589.1 DUF4012 domain-containing protein [Methanobacterium sp. CWC-01]